MAAHETFRSTAGNTTIPLGTAGTGTVAAHPTEANMIVGTGTAFITDFKGVYQLWKQNIWIWAIQSNVILRVTGVLNDELLVVQGVASGIGASNFTVILADVISYGVAPASSSDSVTINGVTFAAGDTYYQEPLIYTPHHSPRFLDAIKVSGNLRISETR